MRCVDVGEADTTKAALEPDAPKPSRLRRDDVVMLDDACSSEIAAGESGTRIDSLYRRGGRAPPPPTSRSRSQSSAAEKDDAFAAAAAEDDSSDDGDDEPGDGTNSCDAAGSD